MVRDLETPLNMDTRISALKFGATLWRLYPAVLSAKEAENHRILKSMQMCARLKNRAVVIGAIGILMRMLEDLLSIKNN